MWEKSLEYFLAAPVLLQILILLLSLAVVSFLVFKLIIKNKQAFKDLIVLIKPTRRKKEKKRITAIVKGNDLINHKLFSYLLNFKSGKCSLLDFKDEGKNKILCEVLFPIYADVFNNNFTKFVKNVNLNETSNAIKIKFTTVIYDSLKQIDEEFMSKADCDNDKEVSEIILDKFKHVNSENIEQAITIAEYVFDSNDRYDNLSKLHSNLFLLITPFERLGSSAINMFKKMNGDIAGRTYKNTKFNARH
jgi:hypothetical protein